MPQNLLVYIFLLCCFFSNAQVLVKHVVYFASNKYNLTAETVSALQQVARQNTGEIIDSVKIYAYCDTVGSIEANEILALNRAKTVKYFLIEREIKSSLLKEIRGFGEREPVNDNSTEALRELNRRAEVLIFSHYNKVQKNETAKEVIPVTAAVKETAGDNVTTGREALDGLRRLISTAEVGKTVRLPNLNFYGSRHFVVTESLPTLDTLAAILKSYPEIEVEIQGYVCCVPKGKEAFDVTERKYNLSSTRAEAVYNDLVKNDIAPSRLKYKGYGSQPMVEEITDEDKAMNRRVELKILKR